MSLIRPTRTNVWGVLLVCSSCLNLALGYQLSRVRTSPPAVPRDPLAIGSRLPELVVSDVQGQFVTIGYPSTLPTVLYVFRPTCDWCTRNQDAINALAEQTRHRYRFVGVSVAMAGLKDYLDAKNIAFPSYAVFSLEMMRAYQLGPTPETIVVSPDGRLEKIWIGAYDGAIAGEIESYFSVKLPPITKQ